MSSSDWIPSPVGEFRKVPSLFRFHQDYERKAKKMPKRAIEFGAQKGGHPDGRDWFTESLAGFRTGRGTHRLGSNILLSPRKLFGTTLWVTIWK